VALGLVRGDQGARLRVDEPCELPVEERLAKLDVALLVDAAEELRGDRHHAGEAEAADAEAAHGAGQLEEIAHGQVAAAQLLADERDGRVA